MFDSLVYRGSGPFVSPIHPNAVGRTLANEPRMRVYNIQIGIYKQHSDMQITFIVECLSYTSWYMRTIRDKKSRATIVVETNQPCCTLADWVARQLFKVDQCQDTFNRKENKKNYSKVCSNCSLLFVFLFLEISVERLLWHICVFADVGPTNMGWNSKHPWQGCFGRTTETRHRHHQYFQIIIIELCTEFQKMRYVAKLYCLMSSWFESLSLSMQDLYSNIPLHKMCQAPIQRWAFPKTHQKLFR